MVVSKVNWHCGRVSFHTCLFTEVPDAEIQIIANYCCRIALSSLLVVCISKKILSKAKWAYSSAIFSL